MRNRLKPLRLSQLDVENFASPSLHSNCDRVYQLLNVILSVIISDLLPPTDTECDDSTPPSVSPSTLPSEPSKKPRPHIDITLKVIALAIFQILPGNHEERYTEVEKQTDIKKEALREIRKKTKNRNYDFKTDGLRILSEYLINASRSGRPNTVCNPDIKRQVIEIVTKDRNSREKSAKIIELEIIPTISRQSVCRLMYKLNFKKVKKIIKSGLNNAQKERRLKFCCKYRDWTLEDWKKVIFSDETSVIVGQKRGSYKVWRRPDEAQIKIITRMRWKGFMEFIF